MSENTATETQNNATSNDNSTKPSSPTTQPQQRFNVHKTNFEKDVVYLYQFGRCPVIPQTSPFCFKVETWLRMTGLKYEIVDHHLKYKSKKGQLPFVECNGEEIADSEIIINKLSEVYDKNLDSSLAPQEKLIGHALRSMLNNHTSWVMRWCRYRRPDEFRKVSKFDVKRETNSKLPKGIINFLFKLHFKNNLKTAVSHGLGHHSEAEIIEFGKNDLKTLSDFLADKTYFFGDEATLLDCEVFAHVSQFWYVPVEGDIKQYMESDCSNLVSFVERMKERYWSDWDEICKIPEPPVASSKKQDKNEAAAAAATGSEKKEDETEKETKEEKEKTEDDGKEKEGDGEVKKEEKNKEEKDDQDNKEKEESK